MELKVIHRTNLSKHRSLSGSIRLPWKSEAVEGSVEVRPSTTKPPCLVIKASPCDAESTSTLTSFFLQNCCIMTLTLLDEFQEPFWCVSSPVCATPAGQARPFDYGGDHFLMDYREPDGQVKLKLVWLREQRQFFVVGLTVYVAVSKVNKHFRREY